MKKNDLTKSLFAALLLASPMVGAEQQYPAVNFEPTILYQDADYIAKNKPSAVPAPVAAETASAASRQTESYTTETKPGQSPGKKEESSMETYLVGLIVLALAGLVFWGGKQPAPKAQAARREDIAAPAAGTGETGVAKYLKNLGASAGATLAETGVAKYLKTLEVSTKGTAALTGVAKYLRNLDSSAK